MTNREIIANYHGLDYIQSLEAEHYKRTGEKLFQGRVKITYAIKKNMRELLEIFETDQYSEFFFQAGKENVGRHNLLG